MQVMHMYPDLGWAKLVQNIHKHANRKQIMCKVMEKTAIAFVDTASRVNDFATQMQQQRMQNDQIASK